MALGQSRQAQALAWTDFETTALPRGNDFSVVHPMEVYVLVTDMDLEPLAAYHRVFKPTPGMIESLRANEVVMQAHKESGLLDDMRKRDEVLDVAETERELVALFQNHTPYDKGEFAIAGSGVAAFDFPLVKHWMPTWTSWLAYYPYDIGIVRRMLSGWAGGNLVPGHAASYGVTKEHRAKADVEAHLEEARAYRAMIRQFAGLSTP